MGGGGDGNDGQQQKHRASIDFDADATSSGALDLLNEAVLVANSMRDELEMLRIDREGEIGCQCRKLNMNKIGKMKDAKLKEELAKRGALVPLMSRDDMITRLREVGGQEKTCTFDCACAAEGIECHWEICGCYHSSRMAMSNSHSSQQVAAAAAKAAQLAASGGGGESKAGEKGENAASAATTEGEVVVTTNKDRLCGNAFGFYKVDSKGIEKYRNAIISGICGEI